MSVVFVYMGLSNDIGSVSEIMPCNKIDRPLVVNRFSGNVDVHNNFAYIITIITFFTRNEISKKS